MINFPCKSRNSVLRANTRNVDIKNNNDIIMQTMYCGSGFGGVQTMATKFNDSCLRCFSKQNSFKKSRRYPAVFSNVPVSVTRNAYSSFLLWYFLKPFGHFTFSKLKTISSVSYGSNSLAVSMSLGTYHKMIKS